MVIFDGESKLNDVRFFLSEAKGSSGFNGYGRLIVSGVWMWAFSAIRIDFSEMGWARILKIAVDASDV